MPNRTVDLSGGLPADREQICSEPPDVPFWCENMLFAVHDPTTDVSLWLHLGTVPNDWSLWHDMCYATLPDGDGVLSMWSFHRTAPERRPAGAHAQAVVPRFPGRIGPVFPPEWLPPAAR